LTHIVASAATELNASAQTMAGTAEGAARLTDIVAGAASQASGNVQTVAAATEQLSASISEIGRQVVESTKITDAAVEEIGRTNDLIEGLDGAAAKITNVVNLISTMTKISEVASTIASAVEQQGAATREIARNAALAAQSTETVSANIAQVTEVTGEAGIAAHEVSMAADDLSQQSESLSAGMGRFLEQIRRRR